MTEVPGGQLPPAAPAAQPGPAPAHSTASKFKAAAPLAAGALAIVAAVAAGSMITGNGADLPPVEMPAQVGEAVPAREVAAANPTVDPSAAPLPIDPARSPPIVEATPAPPAAAAPKPGTAVPGLAFDQAGPANIVQGIEIVVKFKDDAKVKEIVDAFWKDKASAGAKFDALKARRPEFANLKLDRVTYSNELVLVASGANPASQIGAMRELATKLGKSADISYAEPNLTAHPGGQ